MLFCGLLFSPFLFCYFHLPHPQVELFRVTYLLGLRIFLMRHYAGPETDRETGVIITMGEGGVRGEYLCWGLDAEGMNDWEEEKKMKQTMGEDTVV